MKLLKCQKGIAMPLVLIVVLVLSLLGAALWQYSMSELNQSVRDENKSRAYYVARAGAESMAKHIMTNPDILENISTETGIATPVITLPEGEEFTHDGDLEVVIKKIDIKTVEVVSTASFNDVKQSVSILLQTSEGFDGTVYSSSTLNFSEGVEVVGDIVTSGVVMWSNSEVQGEDLLNHPKVTGEIKPGVDIIFPAPVFPEVPETYFTDNLIVDENTLINSSPVSSYKKISIANKKDVFLTVDATSNDILISADDFEINQNSGGLILKTSKNNDLVIVVDTINLRNIKITGDGVAELYIHNKANIQTTSGYIDTTEGTARLDIFMDDGAEMEMVANAYFDGLIYGPGAFVSINGNAVLDGSMIVKELKGSGQGANSQIGSGQVVLSKKYNWDMVGSAYGGYLIVHWVQ